jgi:hypothetical protein
MTAAGSIVTTVLSPITGAAGDLASAGLSAATGWILAGAHAALAETAHVIGTTTAPQLTSTWFSATYWRVAGLSALLTLPFLFAAATQALLRSDLTLLMRSALGYLPLAILGVAIAAPVTMLLLAATDEMCAIIGGSATGGGANFLATITFGSAATSVVTGDAFFAFAVGMITAMAAIMLAVEMLIRSAAVYIVVLLLPLAFASFVWPARRAWTIRAVELLVSLILSKFVVVAVLSLAGAAWGSAGIPGVSRMLVAMSLVILSCFAPWVLVRLLPFTELAAAAGADVGGAIHNHAGRLLPRPPQLGHGDDEAETPAADRAGGLASIPAALRRMATDAGQHGRSVAGDGPADMAIAGLAGVGAGTALGSTSQHGAGAEASGTPDEASAAGASSFATQDAAGGERIPGMSARWQAENFSWTPLSFDPDERWPPSGWSDDDRAPGIENEVTPRRWPERGDDGWQQ